MKQLKWLLCFVLANVQAQYWQQQTDYKIAVDMDIETYQYTGIERITYKNNSPDVLKKVYFHLYNNAFQPQSSMDVYHLNMKDPDQRIVKNLGTNENPIYESKIAVLKPSEQGYLQIKKLTQKGKELVYKVQGTILEVILAKPLKPGKKTRFEVVFEGQVPKQIRRSGRNNKEGVALSMTQWYPKLAAYDKEGWHANEYVGAEFYADWGNYEVAITIDSAYTVGGSGYLQNPNEVKHGYQKGSLYNNKAISEKTIWKFKAPNVHDFSWAADKDYKHIQFKVPDGPSVHLLYKNNLSAEVQESWERLPSVIPQMFQFYKEQVGAYPYKQYTIVQGGDGGMEYAMCTLITGDRNYRSLVGVVAHELAHSWFQFLLATNETKHAWMDEGFTTYISTMLEHKIFDDSSGFQRIKESYNRLVSYNIEEPLTTHGDRFKYNYGYQVSTYHKGALFLEQLNYVIGSEVLKKTLQDYFKQYAFKHPTPLDFIKIAEQNSEMELDWYLNYWTETTNTIDYEVLSVENDKEIVLHKKGEMIMPLEVQVTYDDGSLESFYIPLDVMRGEKKTTTTLLRDWEWAKPTYSFNVVKPIRKVTIDSKQNMCDVDESNNVWVKK